MKLKYYLRGAGVGVIVTTLIFTIAIAFDKPTMSQEDIIREAEKLGMISKDSGTDDDTSDKANTKQEDTDGENTGEGQEEGKTTEMVSFAVARGDSSAAVASRLQEMGLVDDAQAFDNFLAEQNFDNLLLPGEYTIPKDSSFLDIAKILTTKKE
ncbi:MAG: hypothetical protein PUB19_05040 [Lachnospiraceae bacterium]|nr:hypothetical protein [Lachnospiraceae bacterium]